MKANEVTFSFWVSCNYKKIVAVLKNRNVFNEDVFHNSFIELYDNTINDANTSLETYGPLFFKIYKRLSLSAFFESKKYIHFDSEVLDLIASSFIEEEPAETKEPVNPARIVNYLQSNFSKSESNLFLMYALNDSLSVKKLSLYTGESVSVINRRIKNIKKSIVQSFQN